MLLPSRVPPKLSPRVDFQPEEFRKVALTRGLRLTWEQAAECPCVRRRDQVVASSSRLVSYLQSQSLDADILEARADCAVCHGTGYMYHSAQEIRAVVTSCAHKPDFVASYGEFAKSMASFSLLPEHLPAPRDRITLLDSAMVFRETRTRSAATVEKLRYPVFTRTLDLQAGPTTAGVLHCYKTDAAGVATAGNELVEGTDFSATVSGSIDWTLGTPGSAPAQGARYSVAYYACPRYAIVDVPHSIRDTWIKTKKPTAEHQAMPVQAVGMLDFLRGDNE